MAKEIYKKLLEIQKLVKGLSRDKRADKFDYVSGTKILGLVRPKMDEIGLLLVPEVISANFTPQTYQTSKGTKTEMFCSVEMKFTWVDTESGDTLECRWVSSGMNGHDKSLGSALTYGERYFLLKQFHISTDYDDVDANGEIDEENLAKVIAWIGTLTTKEDLNNAWQTYGDYYGKDQRFVVAYTKRVKEVSGGTR